MDYIRIIVSVMSVCVMLYGLKLIFNRLKEKSQGIGDNSLKAMGTVLLIPSILIITLLTELEKSTIAALLGTISGYLLSRGKDSD